MAQEVSLNPVRYLSFIFILAIFTASGLSACTATPEPEEHAYLLASAKLLPELILNEGPLAVQEAYRFAIANQETLIHMPCFCGCGKMGHMNNYDCYVESINKDGSINFETHAFN